ncbi:hypothetical protein [uncultured Algimonas sp.]|uniref:hypothetical protein n=1 Tax=uncultured Algimonas sp. TaxID=1547920 RepID=UPI00261CE6D8|nr:hypothetical protein [uncultured Algimonas sp.]
MTDAQRRAHLWLTGTVDIVYPFAYSAFFVGVFRRFLPSRFGWVMIAVALAVVPFDLIEGFAQLLILNGGLDYLGVKAIATSLKLALYIPALGLAMGLLIVAGVRWMRRAEKAPV